MAARSSRLSVPTRSRQALGAGAVAIFLAAALACARQPARGPAAGPVTWHEILALRGRRDYLTLRDRLEAIDSGDASPEVLVARALVGHAFNDPAGSNRAIDLALARDGLPDSVRLVLRETKVANHVRLFEYAAGLRAVDSVLRDTTRLRPVSLADHRNMRRILEALREVPPQTMELTDATVLRLDEGRTIVTVNDSVRSYVFDTGANLSTIMRSEAAATGLQLLPAGIDVGTSTDQRVTADLAIADRLVLGTAVFRHVVFLVLDDSLLTFPGGYRIPGVIGFPVIERLGEMHFAANGTITVPRPSSAAAKPNLALDELTPLTRVHWDGEGQPLICRLDTGAQTTQFYEPFYRRFRARIDSLTTPTRRETGGAGGVRELPVRLLPNARISLGDTVATLPSAEVVLESIVRDPAENYLDCNVGHDILDAFSEYVINFRAMVFSLR
ncbi:MAG: retropepsin-like aspartic protease [Gemmatimonadales bacterium]